MKIGIAITTHNRPGIADKTFAILDELRPENSMLIVVDDNGRPPFGGYGETSNVFKFKQSVGVSVAKNKCLELLHDAGCTHFFLFDDDCFPVVDKWWEYYTNQTATEHASWTFGREIIKVQGGYYIEYEKPCGCMMFFTRMAINTIGGWDLDFKGYGYEHVNVSDRAFNAGLTPGRYVDVEHPKIFELAECESSFTMSDRMQIPNNLHLYQQKYYSKEFKPFK